MFEWDEEKSRKCRLERGFDFSIVEDFDFGSAILVEDDRKDYGERRIRAFGRVNDVDFCIAFTSRGGKLRIISVRKARMKEMKRHGFYKQRRKGVKRRKGVRPLLGKERTLLERRPLAHTTH